MCGIAGVMKFDKGAQVDAATVRQMCNAMIHRGPDDEGIYTRGCAGLGMRRLSIIDLATGHQPMTNEAGDVWLVFNGEIYNHRSLREQLIARGHRYATKSDTETIVHLYEEYGRECVKHLRGMFAFAVWNEREQKLFIARDRLGIKPLYYCQTPDALVFGSEIKVLLAYPGVRRELNRAALPEYLAFGYLSGEETFYAGIRKLMPGHMLEIEPNGELRVQQYWDLDIATEPAERPQSYYVQTYRELLEQAVESHLMSDVPLGVFLSGGVDSSAVAALMTKIRRQPVETYSVGYAEQSYSELSYARIVAKHIGSLHKEVLVSSEEFFRALPKLIWQEDEPIAWPSSVSLYFVSRLASEHVKVVLTGEGSDETLAGYTRYAFTLKNAAFDRIYRGLVPKGVRAGLRHMLATSSLIHRDLRRKLEHTFLGRNGDSWPSFYFDNFFSAFSAAEQEDLFSEQFCEFNPSAPYTNVLTFWKESSGPMLQRLLHTDIKTYLVELLMKQDNMSMAASIESRVPFLDHVLVEFAARIPRNIQVKGMAGKRVLKQAVADLLPASILYRPKLGFPTPWSLWLAGPQINEMERLLLDPRSLERGLFKRSAVECLFREHRSRHRDNYDRIWRLLNLELWQRVCLEDDSHDGSRSMMEPGIVSAA